MSSSSAASNETSVTTITTMKGISQYIYLKDGLKLRKNEESSDRGGQSEKEEVMAMAISQIVEMCKIIPLDYKLESYLKADLIMTCFGKKEKEEEEDEEDEILLGFIMAEDLSPKNGDKGEKILYISLICTADNTTRYTRVGTYLINTVKELCALNHINTIKLRSLKSAVGFYKKLEFIIDDAENDTENDIDNAENDTENDTENNAKPTMKHMSYNVSKFVPPSKGGRRRKRMNRKTTKPKKRSSNTRRRR